MISDKFIRAVLLTGSIKDHEPVSTVFISPPEQGKTSLVLANPCSNTIVLTDTTGRGIINAVKANPKARHIIINDLIAVTAHKHGVSHYAIAIINALTEEGLQRIDTPIESIIISEGGRKGIITSITIDLMHDQRLWWHRCGFSSRLLPFAYAYREALVIEIKSKIENNLPRDKRKVSTLTNLTKVSLEGKCKAKVRMLADRRADALGETGFRKLKQYRALACGLALDRGSRNVSNVDIETLEEIDHYVNFTKCEKLQ